ncbi:MAG: hypothetical protein QG635_2500 [Bacteroidota bacterium]|nr:hypothetical protein [Bacteroidota bacterium]
MKILIKILKYTILILPIPLLVFVILLRNGVISINYRQHNFEVISDMDYQRKSKPLAKSDFYKNNAQIRTAPDSSVPANYMKYHYSFVEFEEPEKELKNPLKPNSEVLRRGKNRYEAFCIYCHDAKGTGSGYIITKVQLTEDEEGFPKPANLISKTTKAMNDGRLFHILSAGQNLMFPVSDKMNETDRWAVICYIRKLQRESAIK